MRPELAVDPRTENGGMDARRRFQVILAIFGVWVVALGVMAVATAVKPRAPEPPRAAAPAAASER